MVRAVRGAIQLSETTAAAIEKAGTRLVTEMLRQNEIAEDHIVSILFSVTDDLTAANPATGLRRSGFAATPLFCAQEARVEGAMPRVIRALLTFEAAGSGRPVPVYLDGAERLRPDLGGGSASGQAQ
ncbi:MAG TPA: chorismate mutase [Spirochaetia bacterium]|nr:chorismate mutase [Spirochaetia bacterium]